MEETGILENAALLSLVLPDFEPGQNSDGDVVATTVTDRHGRYSFSQLNGVSGTGQYTVRLLSPSGQTPTSTTSTMVEISRGGLDITGIDFTFQRSRFALPESYAIVLSRA
jgi:hypothetical protein